MYWNIWKEFVLNTYQVSLATTQGRVILRFLKKVKRKIALCVSSFPCLLPTLCSTRLRICVSFTISWLSWDICWSTCGLALSTPHQSGRHWRYIMIHQHYLDIAKTTTEDITTSDWEIASHLNGLSGGLPATGLHLLLLKDATLDEALLVVRTVVVTVTEVGGHPGGGAGRLVACLVKAGVGEQGGAGTVGELPTEDGLYNIIP